MSCRYNPLVSICIPTFKRPEIVKKTLESIFAENVGSDILEVCVTDNSTTDETKQMIEEYFSKVPNLRYKKTFCEGFMNSIEALNFGSGKLLKLHNDYSEFKKGELLRFINIVKRYENERPLLFFSMGALKKDISICEFTNFDKFMYGIHYYSTWSSAFAIWKEDFDALNQKVIEIDRMFPHTSYLFNLTQKDKYVIDNTAYVKNIPLNKKGGYNLTDNFVRLYLNMVKQLIIGSDITQITYNKIEKGIIKFVAYWYCNVKYNSKVYSFTFENTEKIIRDVCGENALKNYKLWVAYYNFKFLIKNITKKG